MPIWEPLGDSVLVTHIGFFNFDSEKIHFYFDYFGRIDTEQESLEFQNSSKTASRKERKKRFHKEFKTLGFFRCFYNTINRVYSSYWYVKNKIELYDKI